MLTAYGDDEDMGYGNKQKEASRNQHPGGAGLQHRKENNMNKRMVAAVFSVFLLAAFVLQGGHITAETRNDAVSIAEFVPDPDKYQHKTDVTLSMSGETWVKLYLSTTTPEDLIKQGEIKVKGNATEAAQLLDLFDRYKPEKAMAIPPALFGNAG
jgi:hypothetical protein